MFLDVEVEVEDDGEHLAVEQDKDEDDDEDDEDRNGDCENQEQMLVALLTLWWEILLWIKKPGSAVWDWFHALQQLPGCQGEEKKALVW